MQRRAAAGGSAWWCGAVGACTESLGSESGDAVGYADAEIIDWLRPPAAVAPAEEGQEGEARGARGADEPRLRAASPSPPEEEKGRRPRRGLCLPPVMPRASEALVMRAERRGGRLILTEVRAAERQRRGVFRASRDGGRLQLCFAAAGGSRGGAGTTAPLDDGGGSSEPEEASKQAESGGGGAVAAPHGGEFCQVAAAAGRGRVEIGAVVGI